MKYRPPPVGGQANDRPHAAVTATDRRPSKLAAVTPPRQTVRADEAQGTVAWSRRPRRRPAHQRFARRPARLRQGHALSEAKALLFLKPWRRGAVISEHLVVVEK